MSFQWNLNNNNSPIIIGNGLNSTRKTSSTESGVSQENFVNTYREVVKLALVGKIDEAIALLKKNRN